MARSTAKKAEPPEVLHLRTKHGTHFTVLNREKVLDSRYVAFPVATFIGGAEYHAGYVPLPQLNAAIEETGNNLAREFSGVNILGITIDDNPNLVYTRDPSEEERTVLDQHLERMKTADAQKIAKEHAADMHHIVQLTKKYGNLTELFPHAKAVVRETSAKATRTRKAQK